MALANSYSKQSMMADVSPVLNKATVKSRTGSTALQYQRTQVETASPIRLVIMLYEGAIRFCQLALDGMAAHELSVQHENLLKAQRIVTELLGSLKREEGGEVAENLSRLYAHMLEQLVLANLHDDAEAVQKVQGLLRELWASWVEVERLTEDKREEGKGKREEKQSPISNPQSPIPNVSRLGGLNA